MLSGWALSVEPGSASGDARREDGSLGHGHAEKMVRFLFPLPSSQQERGVILFRVDWQTAVSFKWWGAEDGSCLVRVPLFASRKQASHVNVPPVGSSSSQCPQFVFCFLSNSSSKSLWCFVLFMRFHWPLLIFGFVQWHWRHVFQKPISVLDPLQLGVSNLVCIKKYLFA